MTSSSRVDVAVVGLGPAGASVAIRLARAGFDVLAIDRASFPREKPCAEFMSPATLGELDRLGVLGSVESAGGAPLHGVTVHGPRGASLTGLFAKAGPETFRPTGLSLSRWVLDDLLVTAARAAGARVLERATLTGFRYERGAVAGIVFRRDGRLHEVRARVVVGADGLNSVSARLLGERRFDAPARFAFVAHVEGVARLTETAEMHVGHAGYAGLNALGGGLANVAVVVPARRARAARGDVTGFWHATLQSLPGVQGRVSREALRRPVRATGPFAVRSTRMIADGALLIGDAADFFDPFTGEGIFTALQGGRLAADVLEAALALPGSVGADRLRAYPHLRRRAMAGKWAVERLIGYGMLAPRLFDRAVHRLQQRDLGHVLIGVTGHQLPAGRVLRPGFLAAMMF